MRPLLETLGGRQRETPIGMDSYVAEGKDRSSCRGVHRDRRAA